MEPAAREAHGPSAVVVDHGVFDPVGAFDKSPPACKTHDL